ncbi:hypothetical protein N7513_012876 [Penicillium frequentans]|nr:hypothetical protein N7513_012876 [Penicillium glabrum]
MQSDKTLSSSSPNTASKPSHPYFSAPVSDSKESEREQPWKKIVNKDPSNTSKDDRTWPSLQEEEEEEEEEEQEEGHKSQNR